MRYFLVILFILINYISFTQEICSNGKDDDNDGLIDLKDPDCACKDSLPPLTYLHNASFEDNPSCPDVPGGGLNYIPYWGGGSVYGPDFYNLNCEFNYYYTDVGAFKPPLPLPDGSGFIGLINKGDFEKGLKGYAATCLQNPLLSGLKYSFECYIGFSPDDTNRIFSGVPVELALFGNPNCNAYPFSTYISRGCPLNIDLVNPNRNWVQLGSMKVFGKGNWVKVRIDFTAPVNIKAFLVGTDCVNYRNGYESYFFADDFSLSEEKNFYFKTITVENNNCAEGIKLKAPPGVNANYQWYKDSIAVVGATDSFYIVPNKPSASGNYNVRLVFPNTCIVSSPFLINLSDIASLNLGKDTTLCSGEKLLLKANVKNVQYQWQNNNTDSNFLVQQSGNYSVKVTNANNCSFSDTINVQYKQCTDCAIEIPTAFTPNGDGKNDVFKVLTSCLLVNEFNLQVYNRWGQKIFETKEVTQGWEGNIKDKPLDSGTYIYQLQYKKYGTNTIVRKSGTVVLIR